MKSGINRTNSATVRPHSCGTSCSAAVAVGAYEKRQRERTIRGRGGGGGGGGSLHTQDQKQKKKVTAIEATGSLPFVANSVKAHSFLLLLISSVTVVLFVFSSAVGKSRGALGMSCDGWGGGGGRRGGAEGVLLPVGMQMPQQSRGLMHLLPKEEGKKIKERWCISLNKCPSRLFASLRGDDQRPAMWSLVGIAASDTRRRRGSKSRRREERRRTRRTDRTRLMMVVLPTCGFLPPFSSCPFLPPQPSKIFDDLGSPFRHTRKPLSTKRLISPDSLILTRNTRNSQRLPVSALTASSPQTRSLETGDGRLGSIPFERLGYQEVQKAKAEGLLQPDDARPSLDEPEETSSGVVEGMQADLEALADKGPFGVKKKEKDYVPPEPRREVEPIKQREIQPLVMTNELRSPSPPSAASNRTHEETQSTAVEVQQSDTFKFKAEVSRVMDIIVNSLYTDKDVFLRELVSNSADASDKLRVLLTKDNLYKGEGRIRIKADREHRTLTVEDEGIGMNREDLIHNLGTIAQSGTAKFLKQVAEGSMDATLIGQFGVGFYSAFLVANQVEVVSKRAGPDGDGVWRWRSSPDGTFIVCKIKEDDEIMANQKSGTKVFLHLKDECDEYLEDYKIKDLLRKYSEFVQYPIQVWSEKVEYERVADDTAPVKAGAKPRIKTVTRRFNEWEHINTQPPIWRRDQSVVTDQDYYDFYKATFKSYDDPMAYTHFRVEGQVDFSSVLYVPGSLPYELSRNMFDEDIRGIRLYVKRIFINDKFTEALPRWLKFLRGVVDSEDLPLNVGREILQKSKILAIINKRISQKALDMLRGIRGEGREKWKRLLAAFGKYMKVGVVEDKDNQEQLAGLVEFSSTHSEDDETGLDSYIERMKPNQQGIYYVSAESKKAAEQSPALEKLKRLGYEVIYCTEPIDEFCLSALSLNKYRGYPVLDANKSDLKLSAADQSAEEEKLKRKKIDMESLCEWMQNFFGKKVQRVAISDRLTESPALLVQGDFGLSPTMQRYMKQQASSQGMSEQDVYGMNMNQAVLELNPDHRVIQRLHKMVELDRYSEVAKDVAQLVYYVASLQGGYAVEDPARFARQVTRLMTEEASSYLAKQSSVAEDEPTQGRKSSRFSEASLTGMMMKSPEARCSNATEVGDGKPSGAADAKSLPIVNPSISPQLPELQETRQTEFAKADDKMQTFGRGYTGTPSVGQVANLEMRYGGVPANSTAQETAASATACMTHHLPQSYDLTPSGVSAVGSLPTTAKGGEPTTKDNSMATDSLATPEPNNLRFSKTNVEEAQGGSEDKDMRDSSVTSLLAVDADDHGLRPPTADEVARDSSIVAKGSIPTPASLNDL